jgi:16S rRNA (cytosine1402-N4)-methyltransferase
MKRPEPKIVHKPVLVNQVLEYLDVKPGGIYIDATFGSGGHTRAILDSAPDVRVIAFDWSEQALDTFGTTLQDEYGSRLELVWGNFAHLYKLVKKINVENFDGILADFGTSQVQIKTQAGFSFSHDTHLDMRMSPAHQKLTAYELVNKATPDKLVDIFKNLGEEKRARSIVNAIVTERQKRPINTTKQLADLIVKVVPKGELRIHPATKVFQALRIFVNKELENIQSFLSAATSLLAPEGRLVCISFHSLEDRIVKNFFRQQELMQTLKIVTPQVVIADEKELITNPSARSAKLRAAQKISAS